MRVLLDTHAFLWWVTDDPGLPRRARKVIASASHDILFSLASCWELAIKLSLGKLRLAAPFEKFLPDQLARNGFRELPVTFRHVARVRQLPFHHRDPFDRMLAAQALEDDLAIVSGDPVFRAYGVKRVW
jgi:PIN domain nuclease of toxin-antitoxin system